jgi:hypothetical protein
VSLNTYARKIRRRRGNETLTLPVMPVMRETIRASSRRLLHMKLKSRAEVAPAFAALQAAA